MLKTVKISEEYRHFKLRINHEKQKLKILGCTHVNKSKKKHSDLENAMLY